MQQIKTRNAKWWLDHVETWKKSSLTQSDYCRLNDLNHKSFSNWKLKADKLHSIDKSSQTPVFTSSPIPVQLIPVAISEQTESAAEVIVKAPQLPNPSFSGVTLNVKAGYQVCLAVDFNPSTLKKLLAALAE